jgi:hypothetical protein
MSDAASPSIGSHAIGALTRSSSAGMTPDMRVLWFARKDGYRDKLLRFVNN